MTDLINGTDMAVSLGHRGVLPGHGGIAVGLDFGGVMLSGPDGAAVSLGAVQQLLNEGRTWAAPRGGPAAFFKVAHASTGAPGVLYTTGRTTGAMAGLYRHDGLGLQYFNPSPGATVPAGFQPFGPAAGQSQQEAAAVWAGAFPGWAHTPATLKAPAFQATLAAYDPRLEFTNPAAAVLPCQTVPIELYSLQRLFGTLNVANASPASVRLAQAQGDVVPVQLRVPAGAQAPDADRVNFIEFSAATASARPAGFAALSGGCGGGPAYNPYAANAMAEQLGAKLVAGPPRPQDLIPTRSAADEGSVRALMTHPLATAPRPLGFGQLMANLTPVSDTEIARQEAVKRLNGIMDRYADLRIHSSM